MSLSEKRAAKAIKGNAVRASRAAAALFYWHAAKAARPANAAAGVAVADSTWRRPATVMTTFRICVALVAHRTLS